MAAYKVNKGVNKPVNFIGLKSQYVLYLVILVFFVLLFSFILAVTLNAISSLLVGVISFLLAICGCFKLNNAFGEYGLMQLMASRKLVKHISVTQRVYQIIEDRDGRF